MIGRVWVVSELYHPEDTSTGYHMTKIAERLRQQYDVRVICGRPTYAARGTAVPTREVKNGVEILRCRGTTGNKDNLFFKLLNALTFSLSAFMSAVLRFRKNDIALVVTAPPTLPYIIQVACFIRRAKCIIRMDDVYPDVMVAAGMATERSVTVRLLRWVCSHFNRRADRLIVLGRDMHDFMVEKMYCRPERIRIIPNWSDDASVKPTSRSDNALLKEQGLMDKFVVQYAGNMGHPHGIKILLEAADKLQHDTNIHFLFIGSGYKKEWLVAQVQERGLENITVLGRRPRSEQHIFLNACDIAVSSLIPGMWGLAVPSRTYSIIAAGKPMLAIGDKGSEISMLIQENEIGWFVGSNNADDVVTALRQAAADNGALREMGIRARMLADKTFNETRIGQYYENIIQECQ